MRVRLIAAATVAVGVFFLLETAPARAENLRPGSEASDSLRVNFLSPLIGDARQVRPGQNIFLRVKVTGPRKNFVQLTGPGNWVRKWANTAGENRAVFVVSPNLSGEIKFVVVGTGPDGQESHDELIFFVGEKEPAPPATASAAPQPEPTPTPKPRRLRHGFALGKIWADGATGSVFAAPKFSLAGTHNSRPITGGQSNNFSTADLRLKFSNGLVAGVSALNTPESLNANPFGNPGTSPYLGWGTNFGKVNFSLSLGAQIPNAGAATKNPLLLGIEAYGNPIWEPLSHKIYLRSDLGSHAVIFDNALRLAGEAQGLRLAAIGGVSRKWGSNFEYPQTWMGVQVAGPLALLGADAALGVGYDIPVAKGYGDGVRVFFSLSQF